MKNYDYNGKKNICGARIKEARRALGLSQEQLAAKLQLEGVVSQYQLKSNTPKAIKIRAIYRKLALKVVLCFVHFQKISSNFHSLYVRIILRERIFLQKKSKR